MEKQAEDEQEISNVWVEVVLYLSINGNQIINFSQSYDDTKKQ